MSGRLDADVSTLPVVAEESMYSRAKPWTHVVSERPDVQHLEPGSRVLLLDGTRMSELDGLFREFVRAFEFPEYFGWNWSAFNECVRDLSWLPAHAYLAVVSDGAQV